MTATVTRPAEPALAGEDPVRRDRADVWDRLLDLTVVLLATWTVVYHVCLVARLSVR